MKKLWLFTIFLAGMIYVNASAYDNEDTHPRITEKAVESSDIGEYLIEMLKCPDGTDTALQGITIRKWLMEGSKFEDIPNCRASNHFHNPLREWTESGMRDQPWFINLWCSGGEYPPNNIKSAVHWATGFTAPSVKVDTGNEWDWDHAKEFYYIYLTGKDFQGIEIANTEDQKKEYFAKSLRALGQTLHMLQDMAVPAHVRDDFKSHLEWFGITLETLFYPSEWIGERFEYYVKHHPELISGAEGGQLTDPSVTKFWDTNDYTGQDPDNLNSLMIGFAEYTNMNFVSKNTIFTEDYPQDRNWRG